MEELTTINESDLDITMRDLAYFSNSMQRAVPVRPSAAAASPAATAMIRVPLPELSATLLLVLHGHGFEGEDAELCARLFVEASLDGVSSHGVHRFPRFVKMVRDGVVDAHARAEPVARHGPIERWNGRRGPGNLNAHRCMARAIELAGDHGIGCVALAETTHWMRGGSYGWQAAEAGVIGICWTNTMPNLPPWGATRPRLGNNPLVIAVPRAAGHVVLDMAVSQFSYGALETYRLRGELLPVPGGFGPDGELTRDPGAIEATERVLPMGFWKGSGFALTLDLVAAMLSQGRGTHEIPADPLKETGLSQLFLALDPAFTGEAARAEEIADAIVAHFLGDGIGESVRYPGQHTAETRTRNRAQGVPVDPGIWAQIQVL
jgi:3-dehydro-L-gulonate 2-dehydrogenase